MMEAMTKRWTDERLEERFDGVYRRLDHIGADVRELRGEMNARFDRMDERFEKMTERLEAMHRLMIQGGVVVIAALLGLIGTQL
jgi:hypothetical protein